MTKLLLYFSVVIITSVTFLSAYASDAPNLVGSSLKLDDEVASATEIVTGKFIELNQSSAFTLSGDRYHGQISISDVLKGNAPVSTKVAFWVVPETKESAPNLHDSYIAIIDNHIIHKLLPATANNITKVKALIAQIPKR